MGCWVLGWVGVTQADGHLKAPSSQLLASASSSGHRVLSDSGPPAGADAEYPAGHQGVLCPWSSPAHVPWHLCALRTARSCVVWPPGRLAALWQ